MDRYKFIPIQQVHPMGWLKDQLNIQLKGLSGNLDLIWPDVRDSAWLGGERDGWERLPYWLDGAIPLAFLTEDEPLKKRIAKYIHAILAAQEPDGWLCPCEKESRPAYDLWALFLVGKVLTQWYYCTSDDRIPPCLYRAMKKCLEHIKQYPLFAWAKARWFEAFVTMRMLREYRHEQWMDELEDLLRKQGTDYPALSDKWKVPLNEWQQETHIVNLMMCLKYEAVSKLDNDRYEDQAGKILQTLDQYNGTAVGLITGDECLSGLSPIQGTELCAAVELAYSCEWLFAVTGDAKWADRLERVAYNAFSATMTDDMWAHQYDQMANQIECVRFPGRSVFRTNYKEAHLFGLMPEDGCCTSNFSQGWPKVAASVFMWNEDEIVNCIPAPCTIEARMHNVPVTVSLETEYPFRNRLTYRVHVNEPVTFTLGVRIPSWAKSASVDGKSVVERGIVSIRREWKDTVEIVVDMEREPRLISRPNGLYALEYGSLVFSLPIEGEWEKVEYEAKGIERRFPYCDYQIHRRSDFGFAFASDSFEVKEDTVTGIPFGEKAPALRICAKMAPIDWGFEDGFTSVCAKLPQHTALTGPVREVYLQPYGTTKLRMTEMPMINTQNNTEI